MKKQIEASQAEQKTDEIDQTLLNAVSLSSSSRKKTSILSNQEKRKSKFWANLSLQTRHICNLLLAGLLSCVNFNCCKVYQKECTHSQENPKEIFQGQGSCVQILWEKLKQRWHRGGCPAAQDHTWACNLSRRHKNLHFFCHKPVNLLHSWNLDWFLFLSPHVNAVPSLWTWISTMFDQDLGKGISSDSIDSRSHYTYRGQGGRVATGRVTL